MIFMNILYVNWESFGSKDIIEAMKALGHSIYFTDCELNINDTSIFEKYLLDKITQNNFDAVFSSNYFPCISGPCNKTSTKYISWVYDNPQTALFNPSITNPCNYVFVFDRAQYNNLKNKGIRTVYHMPLAVNAKRLDIIDQLPNDPDFFDSDISLVGSLYNEEHNLYNRMCNTLDPYTKGYLDAVINAQSNIYGYFLLDDIITPTILGNMKKSLPYEPNDDSLESDTYVYANYFLGRKVTEIERLRILNLLSPKYKTTIYTTGDTSSIPSLLNRGPVNYYLEMPKVFYYSKINLNITLKTIQTGIPLRCFDIMGSKGFLLSNYQEELCESFIPGVDFDYYESYQDLINKVEYYLNHEDERLLIANNGYEKVKKFHSYYNRIKTIFEIVNNQ